MGIGSEGQVRQVEGVAGGLWQVYTVRAGEAPVQQRDVGAHGDEGVPEQLELHGGDGGGQRSVAVLLAPKVDEVWTWTGGQEGAIPQPALVQGNRQKSGDNLVCAVCAAKLFV